MSRALCITTLCSSRCVFLRPVAGDAETSRPPYLKEKIKCLFEESIISYGTGNTNETRTIP